MGLRTGTRRSCFSVSGYWVMTLLRPLCFLSFSCFLVQERMCPGNHTFLQRNSRSEIPETTALRVISILSVSVRWLCPLIMSVQILKPLYECKFQCLICLNIAGPQTLNRITESRKFLYLRRKLIMGKRKLPERPFEQQQRAFKVTFQGRPLLVPLCFFPFLAFLKLSSAWSMKGTQKIVENWTRQRATREDSDQNENMVVRSMLFPSSTQFGGSDALR